MTHPLPIGISDFKEIIEGGYVYVDKTLFIQELVEKGDKVSLIPRPRRFGKTLNLSMLRYFFEKSDDSRAHLFEALNIWNDEKYRAMQGQFPVISLSLKDIKCHTWEETLGAFRELIADEFERHSYLLTSQVLSLREAERYDKILCGEDNQALCESSLKLLIRWLNRYHKKRVVLLVDEYDAPAHAAFIEGYYEQLISFLRNWLSGALKDNSLLERGVLTGILRIAKESIFSGLNNITTFSLLKDNFHDKFGLLEWEVVQLLEDYGIPNRLQEMRQWYNGYRIASNEGVYNPWSILNCLKEGGSLAPYWVNTSDNALMKRLITQGAGEIKSDIEELLQGNVIEKHIDEGIIFANLERSPNSIWSLLLFSGYLTLTETPTYGVPCKLCIPNTEIRELYRSMIAEWFEMSIHNSKYHQLLESLVSGDIDTFVLIFQEFLLSSVSFFDISGDEPEKVYHAFVLGLLLGLKGRYDVKSNRESGYGRYDVLLIPHNKNGLGIVMEFKKINPFEAIDLESAVASALTQIATRNYDKELRDRGISRILHVGLAFKGKNVSIRAA